MTEKNSFQWFGIKGEGLMVVLLIVGLILHFKNSFYPVGEIAIVVAIALIVIEKSVSMHIKVKESKSRFYWK